MRRESCSSLERKSQFSIYDSTLHQLRSYLFLATQEERTLAAEQSRPLDSMNWLIAPLLGLGTLRETVCVHSYESFSPSACAV